MIGTTIVVVLEAGSQILRSLLDVCGLLFAVFIAPFSQTTRSVAELVLADDDVLFNCEVH